MNVSEKTEKMMTAQLDDFARAAQGMSHKEMIESYCFRELGSSTRFVNPEAFESELNELINMIVDLNGPTPIVTIDALQTSMRINYSGLENQGLDDFLITRGIDAQVQVPSVLRLLSDLGKIKFVERKNFKAKPISLKEYFEEIPAAAEEVARNIFEAFADIKLEDGVSLHQTIVLDNYGGQDEMDNARKLDETEDWTKLILHPELTEVFGIGGPSFFDAKGLRFHLPSYMCLIILEAGKHHDVFDSVIHSITFLGDHHSKRFGILNVPQLVAISTFLKYLQKFESRVFEFDLERIELALKNYFDR